MNKFKDVLKDSLDYEDYTVNKAKLSVQEMRELGLIKCGGCCSSGNGCSSKNRCCKKKK